MNVLILIPLLFLFYVFLHEWGYQDNKNRLLSIFMCGLVTLIASLTY